MKLHRALMFVTVAALITAFVASQFTNLQDRSLSRLRLLIDPHASMTARTSGRFDLALAGWYIFNDHPLLGVGTGGFSITRADMGLSRGLVAMAWHDLSHVWVGQGLSGKRPPGDSVARRVRSFVCVHGVARPRTRAIEAGAARQHRAHRRMDF